MTRCVVFAVAFFGVFATCVCDATGAEPTHVEIESIGKTAETKFVALSSFDLNGDGNLLACDSRAKVIKVISPKGKLLGEWKLPFGPTRIRCASDGTVYVGGLSVLAKLDGNGKVLKRITLPVTNTRRRRRGTKVSGIAVTGKYVFASFGRGGSLGARATIVRFDRDLGQPKQIAQGMRGCCQRLDLAARDDVLYVAENTRYRIVRLDADGKVLSTWGKRGRTGLEGFGSCCNPMNITFGSNGELYTAESGLGRIKRFTPDGRLLGLVGRVGTRRFSRAGRVASSCSNITISVSKDGRLVFVQDVSAGLIRVLQAKAAQEQK